LSGFSSELVLLLLLHLSLELLFLTLGSCDLFVHSLLFFWGSSSVCALEVLKGLLLGLEFCSLGNCGSGGGSSSGGFIFGASSCVSSFDEWREFSDCLLDLRPGGVHVWNESFGLEDKCVVLSGVLGVKSLCPQVVVLGLQVIICGLSSSFGGLQGSEDCSIGTGFCCFSGFFLSPDLVDLSQDIFFNESLIHHLDLNLGDHLLDLGLLSFGCSGFLIGQ
jgi:hypothetical protein